MPPIEHATLLTDRRYTMAPIEILELREGQDNGSRTIAGYGAVFYQPTDPGSEYRWRPGVYERIMRGAFDDVLKSEADIAVCFNHDESRLLGRRRSGTARFSADEHGLRYEVDLPDTQDAADLLALIGRGDTYGSSIAFRIGNGGDVWKEQGDLQIREITRIGELYETGPVTFPAYTSTSVGLRAEESVEIAAAYEAWKESRIQAELENQKERNRWLHRRARLRAAEISTR